MLNDKITKYNTWTKVLYHPSELQNNHSSLIDGSSICHSIGI
jgi:hypothetical protein